MFTPSRLTLARKRRGFTKTRLAEGAGVTLRSVTAYEAGEIVPTEETIQSLANFLQFPPAFFTAGDIEVPPPDSASFRALKSMTSAKRDAALGAGALAIELSAWIQSKFALPAPDVPDLMGQDPETAADGLRAAWGLGQRPVRNMIHLLESRGVRVFSLAEECREVDAFSLWWSDIPCVFLNTKKSAERSRMDSAHELGHLVLHRAGRATSREQEREAQRFGSAFLMPRASVLGSASGLVTVPKLVRLKRNWNVSVAALAYRLHELSMISDWHYRVLFTQISELGYRTNEPNGIQRETSQVLDKVFRQLRAEGVSKADVARELNLHSSDVDALVFGLVMLPLSGSGRRQSLPRDSSRPELRLVSPDPER